MLFSSIHSQHTSTGRKPRNVDQSWLSWMSACHEFPGFHRFKDADVMENLVDIDTTDIMYGTDVPDFANSMDLMNDMDFIDTADVMDNTDTTDVPDDIDVIDDTDSVEVPSVPDVIVDVDG